MKNIYIALFAVLLILSSCKKDDDKPVEFSTSQVNEWIYENMKLIYFWKDNMPSGVNAKTSTDPKAFYYSLIYKAEDKWSYITDDYVNFLADLEGRPESMGYSPAFGLFSNSDKVFIVVEFVYPDSPADKAGLKRGDIILTIDDTPLDTINYLDLYNKPGYTAGMGTFTGDAITLNSRRISMTSAIIVANPVLESKIIDTLDRKIGYVALAEFITGNAKQYVYAFDNVIEFFYLSGVTDVVVDLRYNPGGQMEMAGHVASCFVPVENIVTNQILVSFLYNDFLTNYYRDTYRDNQEPFYYKFPAVTRNLNLDQIYFLTTGGSASASELVILGLEPYMDVQIIGEPTYGKYTGAWVYPDTETPARHNWAIIPIVMKYANAEGVSNFVNGLQPDYFIEDDLLNAYPLGDVNDPMLQTAISRISGISASTRDQRISRDYTLLKKPGENIRTNLYINPLAPEKQDD